MMLTLFFKTWRDHWKSLISWAGVLVTMTTIQLSIYPTISKSGQVFQKFIDSYPDAIKKMFRMEDYTSGPGFLSTELYSMILPLVLIAVGATFGASATADEEEKGTADLLFSMPISRSKIMASKMAATVSVLFILGFVTYLNIYIGSGLVDMEINLSFLAWGTISCTLIGLFFSGVGYIFGALTGKKGVSLGASSAIGLLFFVFYSIAPLVNDFEFLTPINPFHWALGGNVLFSGPDWPGMTKLLSGTIILYCLSFAILNRKDIRT
jgi:ABC-2 type transport system permease protein